MKLAAHCLLAALLTSPAWPQAPQPDRPTTPQPETGPVVIQVDAGRPQGEFLPIWAYFGADEPNYAYFEEGGKLLRKLGALRPGQVYFRAHNLLTSGDGTTNLKWGSTGANAEDAQGRPVYNWKILDRIFDAYLASGVRPYVQIGFMPKALSTQPEPYENRYFRGDWEAKDFRTGWSYPPKDYDKWRELIRQWALHCAERYGQAEAESWRWEVWNEPNGYWSGTEAEFFKLYDYAVDGVRRALPRAQVGGPHTAGGPGGEWLKNFLEHCRSGTNAATGGQGAPLDFIAFHAKGRPEFVDQHVRMGIWHGLKTTDEAFAIVASFPEFKNLPIILGEADPDGKAARLAPELNYRQGTHYAAYTAAAFARFQELAVRHGVNLQGAVTWAFEFENKPYFAGYRVLSTNGIDLPILNVFRMFAQLQGRRLAVESTGAADVATMITTGVRGRPDINAVATLDHGRLAVLVWNYHDDDVARADATVEVRLNGWPAAAHQPRVTHYRIDAAHSNAFAAWQAMGSPAQPSAEQSAALAKAGQLSTAPAPLLRVDASGQAALQLQLPVQALSLLVLEW